MVRRPSVFLMDEPLSNLDAKLRGHMRSELKRLQAELGVTTIYVTHDQIEAMTLAHRVAIMNRGVVQQIATPRDHLRRPRQPLRRRLHRLAADELPRRRARRRRLRLPRGPLPDRGRRDPPRASPPASAPRTARSRPRAPASIDARVYALELIGDHTLVTCRVGETLLTVKSDKAATWDMDAPVGIAFAEDAVFLFDSSTGERIR